MLDEEARNAAPVAALITAVTCRPSESAVTPPTSWLMTKKS